MDSRTPAFGTSHKVSTTGTNSATAHHNTALGVRNNANMAKAMVSNDGVTRIPGVSTSISTIFSKVASSMSSAAAAS